MKKVVSFSGGRTSAYLCHLMIELYGKENVDFIYMDTGAEHPKTYEFIKKVDKYLGLNLVCLRGDFNQPLGKGHTYKIISINDICHDLGPYREMVKKYGTPGSSSAWCTSRMKEETHDKYCNDKYGKGNYETWLGIRADEPRRVIGEHLGIKWVSRGLSAYDLTITLQHIELNHPVINGIGDIYKDIQDFINKKIDKNIRFMTEACDAEKEDVLNWWDNQPFDLDIPEWLGNCVFCFKKSDLKIAAAAHDEPELYQEWLEMIDSATERSEQERISRHVMYRKKRRIEQVIATFDGSTGDEIKARMRGAKHLDTGSCSESCEVFQ